jgi:hypothetical protein
VSTTRPVPTGVAARFAALDGLPLADADADVERIECGTAERLLTPQGFVKT